MTARTKCPDCQSSDGLAEYDDGQYCHACQTQSKTSRKLVQTKTMRQEVKIPLRDKQWSAIASMFLMQYDIEEYYDNKHPCVYFNSDIKRLVFPYRNFAWMRSIYPDIKPKWLYAGPRPQPELYYLEVKSNVVEKDLVICEDVISCIRISEFNDCISLMGTRITKTMEHQIYSKCIPWCDRIILWLDGDKAGITARYKLKRQLQKITNIPIKIIRTKRDPKCYSSEEMKKILDKV